MKSEERHQLLTNDLEAATTKTAGFVEQHAATVIAVVVAVVLLVGIIFWQTQSSESAHAAGWQRLQDAKTLEDFGSVADDFKGTPPAHWAKLQIAEKTLQNALPLMFTNRELALTDLKSARDAFDSLIQDTNVSSAVRERSLWGVAQCLEATSDGDTSKAADAYSRLVKEHPKTIFLAAADERIALLKKKEAGEFYTWFSKENPKPPEARPRDIQFNPPASGAKDSIEIPGAGTAAPKTDEKPAEEAKTETPATDDKPKTEEKAEAPKTDAPPAAEKPAEPEKPAAAEPAKDGEKKEEPAVEKK